MTPIPDFGGAEFRPDYAESGGIFFTPSNTAKNNYLYLKCAGCREADTGYQSDQPVTDSYMLLYTYSGAGELEYMDRRFTVKAGDGFLIDCRQPYSFCCGADSNSWDFVWFNMGGNTFPVYYSQFAATHKPVFHASEGSELEELIRKLGRTAAQKNSAQSELMASTTIICILTQLALLGGWGANMSAERRSVPGYIDGIMERMTSDYASHITLDSLAAEFNVSKYHLSREFKKYTGYSPNEYLISVRINRAKELLRRTNHSVGEISQLTGCGDVNHFIQLFKSREKTTPAAFRRHWQDD